MCALHLCPGQVHPFPIASLLLFSTTLFPQPPCPSCQGLPCSARLPGLSSSSLSPPVQLVDQWALSGWFTLPWALASRFCLTFPYTCNQNSSSLLPLRYFFVSLFSDPWHSTWECSSYRSCVTCLPVYILLKMKDSALAISYAS